MTQITAEQQRLGAAARSVGAKLQAFHDQLNPGEQEVLGLALRQIAAASNETAQDTAGHLLQGQPSLIDGRALQETAVMKVVRAVVGVFRI